MVLVGSALAVGIRPGIGQEQADAQTLLELFDDPTLVARQIDQRVNGAIAACMRAQDFEYELSPTALFDLEETTLESALSPDLARSFGDLVPQIAPTDDFRLEAVEFLDDPSLLDPGEALIETGDLDPGSFSNIFDDASMVEFRMTDIGTRLQPLTEGYGIGLDAYQVARADPNMAIVEELTPAALEDYETALYGIPLDEVASTDDIGGCAEDGFDVLTDEILPELMARDAELKALEDSIQNDPDFTSAVVAWSGCMAESGIASAADLQSLDQAVAMSNERFLAAGNDASALAEARDFERQLATADFACRAKTTDLAVAAVVLREGGDYAINTRQFVDSMEGS